MDLLQSALLLLRSAYAGTRSCEYLDSGHDMTFTNVVNKASLEPERVATRRPTHESCERGMYVISVG